MPELPDLEVFSHNLRKKLVGKVVKKVTVNTKKLNVSAKELTDVLIDQHIKDIYREGKELHIKFSNGDVLGLHLMLHGQLHFFDGESKQNYPVIELLFEDHSGLLLTDFQKAATPTLNPGQKTAPDALSKEMNLEYLKEKLGKTKISIKTVLLDQKIIRGIGNAYADEILWDAKISPFSSSNKIPQERIMDLGKSIRSVLQKAQKEIIKKNPDIISGEVRDFMLIHNPKKSKSPDGAEIKVRADARKTYYTDEQEIFN